MWNELLSKVLDLNPPLQQQPLPTQDSFDQYLHAFSQYSHLNQCTLFLLDAARKEFVHERDREHCRYEDWKA